MCPPTSASAHADDRPADHGSSTWLSAIGRAGNAAKGLVYVLVGGLAVASALGLGGSVGGSKNAIESLADQPFGQIALAAVAVGLLSYTVWRMAQVFVAGGDAGRRAARFVSGLSYLGLALFAGTLALRSTVWASGSGSSGGASDWTATLMEQPYGRWLVAAVGAVVLGFGLRQFQRARGASFMDHYRTGEMSSAERSAAKRFGQIGLSARGVVFCMIGAFTVRAALQADPSESKGLGGALHALTEQPYGRWLMAVVALGLAAYGVLCFSYARYRDFGRT